MNRRAEKRRDGGAAKFLLHRTQFACSAAVRLSAVENDSFSAIVPVLPATRNRLTFIADFGATQRNDHLPQFSVQWHAIC
jgi:fatty acid/phospholipid biosynthesis enzyme